MSSPTTSPAVTPSKRLIDELDNHHEPYKHYNTPQRAQLHGAIASLDKQGVVYIKTDVFAEHGFSTAVVGAAIELYRKQRINKRRRGRKRIFTPAIMREMQRIIRDYGMEGRRLTWKSLAYEAGIVASENTIRTAMGTLNYRYCRGCKKGWVDPATAKDRLQWSRVMKQKYPNPEDWEIIRFSDETHFDYGNGNDLDFVLCKPGERETCIDCRSEESPPDDKTDPNGDKSIREEDGDSESKENIVQKWKRENNLFFYFNCRASPDLSPIENCWQGPSGQVRRHPHFDFATTSTLALEGWEAVSIESINERVHSMPQRLQDCIEVEEQLTGH
ncbi:hypothetical protein EDC01DRAFT_718822 [Geopyxis carbonaria]|nr:hypothetical protein EDC01DRAFT_718822 [Geopyxis carbonaria]